MATRPARSSSPSPSRPSPPAGQTRTEEDASQVPAGVAEQSQVLADEIAENGKTVESGAWTVNLITEAAEPWHEVHGDGHTKFRDVRPGETNHIEIIPVDTASGRIVPDVPIALEVIDADGQVVAKDEGLTFYGSTFFHYANNFSVAQPGTYTVKATLGAPDFPVARRGGRGPSTVRGHGGPVRRRGAGCVRDRCPRAGRRVEDRGRPAVPGWVRRLPGLAAAPAFVATVIPGRGTTRALGLPGRPSNAAEPRSGALRPPRRAHRGLRRGFFLPWTGWPRSTSWASEASRTW